MSFGQNRFAEFQELIWDFYARNKRDFPWQETSDPYHIFISEIMLQRTQASRVIIEYEQFIRALPSFAALAPVPFDTVLRLWQGLGYNRQAKYVQESAKRVVNEFGGKLPQDPNVLATFPGLGPATAASICTFAFNMPVALIETNIRRV